MRKRTTRTRSLSLFLLAAALGFLSPDLLSPDLHCPDLFSADRLSPDSLSADLPSPTADQYTCRTVEYRDPNNPNKAGWIVVEERGTELILHVGNDDSNFAIYQRIYGRSMGVAGWLRIGRTWQDALNAAQEKCREWLKKNTQTPPPVQIRNAQQEPFVAEMVVEQRHLTRDKAQVRVSARVEYPDIKAYRPANVLFTVRIGQTTKTYRTQDPGIVQRGSYFFLTSVLEVERAGEFTASVILRDQSFRRSEASGALAYENEMRVPVKVSRPAAEIKALNNQVYIARADPATASGGRRLGRQSDDFSSPKKSWFKLDGPSPFPPADWAADPFADETIRVGLPDRNRFVYEGDKIGLLGEGRPRVDRTHDEWNITLAEVSSVELEWEGGIRGRAIYLPTMNMNMEGEFVVGNTRGTSGRWQQAWGEWLASGCTWLFEQGAGLLAGKGIDWLILKAGVGASYVNSPVFMVFDLSAGGTLYEDLVYVNLNSSVYIRSGAGQVEVFTFEGSPEVLAPSNSAPIALKPGQMVAVKPGSMSAPRAFEPRELSRGGEGERKEQYDPRMQKPQAHIPQLNADVVSFQFFEGGVTPPPYEKRRFQQTFDAKSSRYITWQLELKYPQRKAREDFIIETVYYRQDGSVRNRMTTSCRLEAGWMQSYYESGWGTEEGGSWEPGVYRVELLLDGTVIATGQFAVTGEETQVQRTYDFSVWPLEEKLNVALQRLDQAIRNSQSAEQRNGYSRGRDLVDLSKREYPRYRGSEGPLFSGSTDPADCPHGLMKVLRICHEDVLQSRASWQRSPRSPDMTEAAFKNASDAIRAAEEAMAQAVQAVIDLRGWRTHTGQNGAAVQAPPAFEVFKPENWPLALRVLNASGQVERSVLITWHAKPENLSEREFQDQAIATHKREHPDLRDLELWQQWPGIAGNWFSYRYSWEGQEIKALVYQNPWGPLPWELRYMAPPAKFDIEECEEIIRSLEQKF